MEFHEKIQELRKNRGLTQEELASVLYVSRTAISKWESGRGYPNIDSLKDISYFFDVSINDLLSSEKLLTIAQKENKLNIQNMCDLIFGIVDVFSILLILLPLYPNTINSYIYCVNLFEYIETTSFNISLYWIMYSSLILLGIMKVLFTKFRFDSYNKVLTYISLIISIIIVLFLALTRVVYAIVLAFILLIIKGIMLIKSIKL